MEIKEENQQVVEEEKAVTPAEEEIEPEVEAQATEPSPKINVIKLEKRESEKSFDEVIEEERVKIQKTYKTTTTINNVLLMFVAAVFVASFILITRGQWGQITGWSLIGVTVAGLVVYYVTTRKRIPNASRQYFRTFWEESNNYLFDDEKFKDCEIDIDERYELADVISQRVYKDVVNVASRNIVRGKYNDKDFSFGELGLYVPGQKRNSKDVVFVGRLLELDNKLSFEGRYIMNIRSADNAVDLPTDIEDLAVLYEEGLLKVYGPEGSDYEKDLGKALINDLVAISCNAPLLNVNVLLFGKKTFCYLSYDDSIVAIPFDKKIDPNCYAALKKNIGDMFDILTK